MESYEFNITIYGEGKDVDEAFEKALKRLAESPEEAICQEVIYTKKIKSDQNDVEN